MVSRAPLLIALLALQSLLLAPSPSHVMVQYGALKYVDEDVVDAGTFLGRIYECLDQEEE